MSYYSVSSYGWSRRPLRPLTEMGVQILVCPVPEVTTQVPSMVRTLGSSPHVTRTLRIIVNVPAVPVNVSVACTLTNFPGPGPGSDLASVHRSRSGGDDPD